MKSIQFNGKNLDFSNPENWTFSAIVMFSAPTNEDYADMINEMLDEMVYANSGNIGCDVWDETTARANAVPGSRFANRSTCDHCGAHFNYGAAYVNAQGEYAIVGNICASNNLNLSAHQYADKRVRSLVKSAKSRVKSELAISKLLPNRLAALNFDHHICNDIRSNFRQYHSLSLKQWALVKKIVAQAAEIAAKKALEPTPVAIPSHMLDGRHEVTGEFLARKTEEGYYGYVTKMLVRDDRGFKVWGTCPESLSEADEGDKVSFFAAIQASNDDECFGFFRRPTKATFQRL